MTDTDARLMELIREMGMEGKFLNFTLFKEPILFNIFTKEYVKQITESGEIITTENKEEAKVFDTIDIYRDMKKYDLWEKNYSPRSKVG